MPRLIDRTGVREDRFTAVAAADAPAAGSAVLVSFADFQADRARWLAHDGPLGVRLAPADDPLALADVVAKLSLVAIEFPSFVDGRGYSLARLVRERLGYTGELRAVGDVLRDQLFFYARCGFDTYALRDDQDVDVCLEAFADFTESYQGANDRGPLFARRFPAATAAHGRPAGAPAGRGDAPSASATPSR